MLTWIAGRPDADGARLFIGEKTFDWPFAAPSIEQNREDAKEIVVYYATVFRPGGNAIMFVHRRAGV